VTATTHNAEVVPIFGEEWADLLVGYTTMDGNIHERVYECQYLISNVSEITSSIGRHMVEEGVMLDTIDYVQLRRGATDGH